MTIPMGKNNEGGLVGCEHCHWRETMKGRWQERSTKKRVVDHRGEISMQEEPTVGKGAKRILFVDDRIQRTEKSNGRISIQANAR